MNFLLSGQREATKETTLIGQTYQLYFVSHDSIGAVLIPIPAKDGELLAF